MMTPVIPVDGMPDVAAWQIHRYALIEQLSSTHEELVVLIVSERGNPVAWDLIVMLDPSTLRVLRAVAKQPGQQHFRLSPDELAGNIVDIAQTLVEQHRAALFTPPSRR